MSLPQDFIQPPKVAGYTRSQRRLTVILLTMILIELLGSAAIFWFTR